MVDTAYRTRAADAIARYMRGEADNFDLDDTLMDYRGDDQAVQRIGLSLWGTYDDIKRHPVSVSRAGWQLYRRCIAFLLTHLELPRKDAPTADLTVWPFQSRRQLIAARPRLKMLGLPDYDREIHDQPIRSRVEDASMWLLFWVCMIVIAIAALDLFW